MSKYVIVFVTAIFLFSVSCTDQNAFETIDASSTLNKFGIQSYTVLNHSGKKIYSLNSKKTFLNDMLFSFSVDNSSEIDFFRLEKKSSGFFLEVQSEGNNKKLTAKKNSDDKLKSVFLNESPDTDLIKNNMDNLNLMTLMLEDLTNGVLKKSLKSSQNRPYNGNILRKTSSASGLDNYAEVVSFTRSGACSNISEQVNFECNNQYCFGCIDGEVSCDCYCQFGDYACVCSGSGTECSGPQ